MTTYLHTHIYALQTSTRKPVKVRLGYMEIPGQCSYFLFTQDYQYGRMLTEGTPVHNVWFCGELLWYTSNAPFYSAALYIYSPGVMYTKSVQDMSQA